MKHLRAALIIVLITVLFRTAASANTPNWQLLRTRHFIVYSTSKQHPKAEQAANTAEKWFSILTDKLGFEPGEATPIYLYPDRRSFAEATGVERAEPVVGITQTRVNSIRVDASGSFADIQHIIPHELVHVFLSYKLKSNFMRLPLWMHEGIAKYLSSDWSSKDEELLANAAASGRFFPLSELKISFPTNQDKRSIAYLQSYSVVRYIADTYGDRSITDLLTEIEGGRLFPEAMFYSLGIRPERLETDWQSYIRDEYKLDRWIKISLATASFGMAALAVLAFIRRRIQIRRKSQELEDEQIG